MAVKQTPTPKAGNGRSGQTVATNQLFTITELLTVTKEIPPAPQFLKDTLFGEIETSWGEQIAVDFQRGSSRASPFCSPFKRGIAIPRKRFQTQWVRPPDVKVTRDIRALDTRWRVAGEDAFSARGADQRIADLQAFDYQDLDSEISRREEVMVSQCLFEGKVTCLDGDDLQPIMEIDYGPINEVVIDPAAYWDTDAGDPLRDLQLMRRHVTSSGYPANLYVLGADAANAFMGNEKVRQSSNFINFRQGSIDPQVFQDYENFGVNVIGDFWGMPVLSYEGMYEDGLDSKMKYFMPPNQVLIASKTHQHRFCYGGIVQVDEGPTVTDYQLARVPQYIADPTEDQLKFRLWSRPLPVPSNTLTWATARVCTLVSRSINVPRG